MARALVRLPGLGAAPVRPAYRPEVTCGFIHMPPTEDLVQGDLVQGDLAQRVQPMDLDTQLRGIRAVLRELRER